MSAPINSSSDSNSPASYVGNILLTMLAPIFWGTTYIVTTEFLPANLPFYAAVIRVLPAGIILLLIVRKLPKYEQWLQTIVLSFLNISCFQTLLFVAAYRLPGGIAAVLGAIQPLIIMILLWQINHITPKPITIFFTISAIIGMAMLLITPNSTWDLIGLLAALFGAISMALGIYLTKIWQPNVDNLTFTAWQLLFGGLMLLPIALLSESFPASLTINYILGYSYLAIFGSLIAYSLWFRGIKKLPSVAVSILGSLSPITATSIGWLLLGERLSVIQSLGFVVIIFSVFIVQFSTKTNEL